MERLPLTCVMDTLCQMTRDELEEAKKEIHQLQNRASPLRRLPRELRNHIYSLVIEDRLGRLTGGRHHHRYNWVAPRCLIPPLFRTCRLVRSEGLSLFYRDIMTVIKFDHRTRGWRELSAALPECSYLKLHLHIKLILRQFLTQEQAYTQTNV